MPVFNEYSYKPLSEENVIRLVALDAAEDETASLTCRIIEQRASTQRVDYTAVSYVWGKHEFSRTIEIRCDEDVKYLKITPNLDALLKAFREKENPRYFWIDAICLNQNDSLEKAQQIPLMGNIYKEAVAVDIWLGPEDQMTTGLFKFFRKLSRVPDVTKWKTQWDMAGRITFLMKKYFRYGSWEAMKAINEFFQRPWFSRRWIIQEACLARHATVHGGSRRSLPLSLLSLAATRFQRMDMSDYAIKVAANLGCQTTGLSMLELLWHFHEAACLEPKDRIAAFLSLGLQGQQLRLDYTKHWTELYKDFASFTYSRGHNDSNLQLLLQLFEFGSVSKPDDNTYPSWVPDWSQSRRRRLPYDSRIHNVDTYEVYPKSPGYSDKAIVAFRDGSLQIDWGMSGAGPRSHRVAFTATFDTVQHTEDCKTRQAIDIVEGLFPSMPDARLGIVALAVLLKTVSEFRHPIAEQEKTSRSLGRFERNLRKFHQDLYDQQLLTWLRTIQSVLQDFCLVTLEAFERNGLSDSRGYGIGPAAMRRDDVLIPLWSLEIGSPWSRSHIDTSGTSIQLCTMLAVRRNGGQLSAIAGGDTRIPVGKIICPVICITLDRAVSECLSDARQGGGTDLGEWSSMRVI